MPRLEWWEKLTNDEAYSKLSELIHTKGQLKVITSQHACNCNTTGHAPRNAEENNICQAHKYDLRDPRHFVCHDVISISDIRYDGYVDAYTIEGDRESADSARYLLYRLTLHSDEDYINDLYAVGNEPD